MIEQLDLFSSFLSGLAAMAYLHNFFVSVILYRSGHANVSNILKVIFNFSGIARSVVMYALVMVSQNISNDQCSALTYLQDVANFFYRQALMGFLLWRLKQIEYSFWDRWISFGLFTARTILNFTDILIKLAFFGYASPKLITQPDTSNTICDSAHEFGALPIYLSFVGIDFIIDTFVTVRLVQILTEGNRSAAEVNSIIGRKPTTKRTLFTAVLYWNFLRLTIDFLYNAITVILAVENPSINNSVLYSLMCFVTIAQSYLITVDAEIVKVIEGSSENPPNIEWLNSIIDDGRGTRDVPPSSSSTARSTSKYQKIIKPLFISTSPVTCRPQYTPPTALIRESMLGQRQTGSFQLNKGKIVVVSMQRLSFFEWANMVTGADNNSVDNNENSYIDHEFKRTKIGRDGMISNNSLNNIGKDSVRLLDGNNSLIPESAYISQSRRGSDTSTMSNSSLQTKTNDTHFINELNYKQSFI
ncbi:5034_t:CDS:2 [Dentiscutata erythropus]|uniref:5034_t:CDS:1 n=1 Tax=Dentiscutata erythropus TaxID=1348616 RepID=A0A9N9CG76_9GLOM|nr:5034_t:CDS:2 [Dentiscutata erythropus]